MTTVSTVSTARREPCNAKRTTFDPPNRRSAFVASVAIFAAAAAVSQEPAYPLGVTDSLIARGAVVYFGPANCDACHGVDGRGSDIAPDLTDGEWRWGDGTYEEIVRRVFHGVSREEARSRIPMPMRGAAEISDADVRAVAAYVWSLRRR